MTPETPTDPNRVEPAPERVCARCGCEVLPGDAVLERKWTRGPDVGDGPCNYSWIVENQDAKPLRHKDLLCLVYLTRKSTIVMVPEAWNKP